jgi:hypothetical protein
MNSSIKQRQAHNWLWLGPLLYMIVVGIYFTGRFAGQWAESDSSAFTQFTSALLREGRLVPVNGALYANGYTTQIVSAYIVTLTGVDILTLQQVLYPIIAALVVLPAWLLYRELTGSDRGATLATIVLFTQPEFLFVILRSSHEKFTRALMMLTLYWLVRSFKMRDRPWMFALHVGLFYFTAYGFIASNNLLAHSFIFAVMLALTFAWFMERRNSTDRRDHLLLQRLPYAAAICLGLDYLFTFYTYAPAQHDLRVLRNIWDRLAALFLDVQAESVNPYTAVQAGWINLPVYFFVSIADWIILGVSVGLWLRQSWRWLRKGQAPATREARLLWLFYTAFAVQGAIAIVTDASGGMGNLQHRLFSSFSIVAAALVGAALAGWRLPRRAVLVRAGLAFVMSFVAVTSLAKATNEPILSNFWTFYRANELSVMEWSDAHLRNAYIWAEFNERLAMAFAMTTKQPLGESYETPNGNQIGAGLLAPFMHDIIITDVTRLHSRRLQRPLPVPPDALRVYDNGSAELYHLRPQTPYQQ